jgi:signal transduction histidine kinase
MMFSSLRARLWLSYALLIGLMLAVVGVTLVVTILKNPQVYRTQLPRLRLAGEQVAAVLNPILPRANSERLQKLVDKAAGELNFRFVVTDSAGGVLADSGKSTFLAWWEFDPGNLSGLTSANRPDLIRDYRRRVWIYTAVELEDSSYLLIMERLAALPLVNLLRNEVVSPLLLAGLVAVLVAALLVVAMSRWISAPLQQMVNASRALAQGREETVPERGPDEVQELARAMNEMSRQVRAGQQSQRDFVANVSHELKTPLTSIQGFAQAILDGAAATPEALRQSAEVIYAESTRMYRLVLELLALARLEAGTADLRHEPVDLSLLLAAVADRFSLQAQNAQVTLRCTVPQELRMQGDGDRLAQVFNNLIDNALKFTPLGGTVEISALAAEGNVTVAVADTGKGIPEVDRERIFERFYQTDKARSRSPERGIGLGLPIARQIVLAHGGKLWVESATTQGSRFLVKLPLSRPEPPSQVARPTGKA